MSRTLLVGTLLASGGILLLVFVLVPARPLVYSVSVSEFFQRGLWDRPVRVHGVLVHGTLCKLNAECGYRFEMRDAAAASPRALSISHDGCVLPDTFRDLPGIDLEVTVEGERCRSCHDLKASQVMARGGGKYEMARMDAGIIGPFQPMPRCSPATTRM